MLEAIVLAITLAVAQALVGIALVRLAMTKWFMQKYIKWFMRFMKDIEELEFKDEEGL